VLRLVEEARHQTLSDDAHECHAGRNGRALPAFLTALPYSLIVDLSLTTLEEARKQERAGEKQTACFAHFLGGAFGSHLYPFSLMFLSAVEQG
jgi:hypothetical protein